MIDIENQLTLDERSSVDFILALRKRWSDTVYPALAEEYRATGPVADSVDDATGRLRELRLYPWYSHLERVQQKMLWKTVGEAVVSRAGELREQLDELPDTPQGTLELDSDVELPDWYTDYDIHIQPGSFYSDDLSAYVYELGARIVMLRDNDGYKFHRLFTETALPDLPAAARVVDIGCGFGKSTRPLALRYPGAEVIGIDFAAPGLRLAHAEAEAEGAAITYRQGDGRNTGIDDASCDVVTGTMVLHEMPAEAVRETVREAARLLRPGGTMSFLEFHPTGDPFRDATIHEHAERNNEPFFRDLFATDLLDICAQAGLTGADWTPFDERREGKRPEGWGDRREWHFPWAVLTATKPEN
ncbi:MULTISPECIES: methyltransferase domain-containing protein [Streptomyces]|uniref:methyltransferase domain-containing protein n=1 Tax=Streptomyces TaxID=1883 RepID=UPI000CD5A073|nr:MULTISPECIES: methyltransferase domain-containing protein [unclassified Streptomyces]AWL42313.1 class I SAM-dependent methyltransferase [Streptomyces sp. SM18]